MSRAAERKIALCVSSWAADSTLYAWTFVKNYFLRVCCPLARRIAAHIPCRALRSVPWRACYSGVGNMNSDCCGARMHQLFLRVFKQNLLRVSGALDAPVWALSVGCHMCRPERLGRPAEVLSACVIPSQGASNCWGASGETRDRVQPVEGRRGAQAIPPLFAKSGRSSTERAEVAHAAGAHRSSAMPSATRC